jgi:hypothetical protein
MNNNERKILRLLIVVAGIVLGQVILYGPSLAGWKILLPLDILTAHNVYIPQAPASPGMEPQNVVLSDLVYQFEPARRFAVSEIHQGRFPLWATYHYGGVPFVWPKYSLFLLLECCVKSPVILAWAQLVAALVAGAGMYFFCRRSLGVSFWPASVCAWCYPLTAFFVLWQGFPTGLAVYWLPWIFLCVDKTMRGASPLAAMGLSVVTFLTLTSGHIDVAGQVLLGSGIYAVWCLWDAHRVGWPIRKLRRAITLLVMGWGLGFLLAAPHLLPLIEYAKTGSRILQRSNGAEERPPTGLVALPQIVLPDIYGTFDRGCLYIIPANGGTNLTESAAAGYTGVLATLVVAPLAWCGRRRRTLNAFWIFLGVFGLGWCLDIPGFVNLLRLPGLNMMSHNRLVFLTSFAILSMTAIGLENLVQGPVRRRWWFWLPAALLAGLFGWCIYRSHVLPEPVASKVEYGLAHGQTYGTIQNIHDLRHAQAWFIQHYTVMALFCGLGFAGWLLLWFQKTGVFRLFPVLAVFLVGDLLWFDHGRSAQCDPSLYYPKIPALDAVAKSVPGRVVGAGCLPASVSLMAGLNDICGYDSIDPARMVGLLNTTGEPVKEPTYAATQFFCKIDSIRGVAGGKRALLAFAGPFQTVLCDTPFQFWWKTSSACSRAWPACSAAAATTLTRSTSARRTTPTSRA